MIYLNMPTAIIGAFLLLTLLVGIYFSRKKNTFREHAVGNKSFATATLVATALATIYGGAGLVRSVKCIYTDGLYWIMIMISDCISTWFISRLGLRMGPFMEHFSTAETIGSIYGRYTRIICSS